MTMKMVRSKLDEQRRELDAFLRLLSHLDNRLTLRTAKTRCGDLPSKDSFTAMKATAFIMLYNIIEATVTMTINELYQTIESEGCRWEDVNPKIRDVWLSQRYALPISTATPETYKNTTRLLIEETANGAILNLNSKQLSLGGNVSAKVTREICSRHGCNLTIPKHAKGGSELDTVKKQRNGLAHGDITFIECGREYDVSDLKRISKECFSFLLSFIGSFKKFILNKRYLIVSPTLIINPNTP